MNKLTQTWLIFVNVEAIKGYKFNDLIDIEEEQNQNIEYTGAWGNVIIKSPTIPQALNILSLGLKELCFKVKFIDKIENINSLIEEGKLNESVIYENEWLIKSNYVFKISDRLFPYE